MYRDPALDSAPTLPYFRRESPAAAHLVQEPTRRAEGHFVRKHALVAGETSFDAVTDPVPYYQYFWWVNPDAGTHFFASGNHGQKIYIVPEQRLIFVRFGKSDPYRQWEGLFEAMARRIAESEHGVRQVESAR